ncbi:Type IIS restriction enzyme Eco57I [termite gut metagenome]|uniref:site-specific DNA-methyltransferase (adenine-specific) n=1 Tax=termite gut metagenome TaxID=433724 RepID=A0A5J4QS43_9ZZZZ
MSLLNDIVGEYNAELFNNGSFWEEEHTKKHFLNNNIASERLVKGLREIRKQLNQIKSFAPELVDRLLIVCILIKYLEENGTDKDTGRNLAHAFFERATGFTQLETIIANNKLCSLLDALTAHFNGGIFSLNERQRKELEQTDIRSLASFFEADYKNNLFGWREYSFEHIPVELISNFYEEFISKEKSSDERNGAVYTPSFLVNLLIDECLPLQYDRLNENVRLIDPSCGSGIFLVAAYKRLVQRWRFNNRSNNKLADTNPEILKSILARNIYGVDINPISVHLSIFSLQLALCSMLTPKQIWTELGHFDNLETNNIIWKDFFEFLIDENTKKDFDIVIGNPPFCSRNKLQGKSIAYYESLLKEKYPVKFINREKEFALLFLEKAMHLLQEKKGRLCLILPSGPFLYLKESAMSYRQSFFNQYSVRQIIDFTFLRRILFRSTVAAMALIVEYRNNNWERDILHIVAKRTKTSKEKSYFEFDHYDFYNVPQELANATPNIWKCNLIGGSMVYNLVKKLDRKNYKVKDFCNNRNIKSLATVNRNTFINNNTWAIRKKITKGNFPTEVVLSDFKEDGFDGINYTGPKEYLSSLKDYFRNNSQTICFYIAATSGRQGIRSSYVINLSDINDLPYYENLQNCLTPRDLIIINDVANYILDEFGNGEKATINRKSATIENLTEYSNIYCNSLNTIYKHGAEHYIPGKIIEGDAYFICEFHYTNDNNVASLKHEKTKDLLDSLLVAWNLTQSGKINRILRIYTPNCIKIVKPKLLRYWMKSKALRDADETFEDTISQITQHATPGNYSRSPPYPLNRYTKHYLNL